MRLFLAISLLAMSATLATAQTRRQLEIPVAPAEITTTVPPSTTGPDTVAPQPFPPSPIKPRGQSDQTDAPAASATTRGSQTQTVSPSSITRPDVPTVAPPSARAICYERQVFNPNTFEYQWQQVCD